MSAIKHSDRAEALKNIDRLLELAGALEKRICELSEADRLLGRLEREMQRREEQQTEIERTIEGAEGMIEKLETLVTELERRSSGPEYRRQELLRKATEIFAAVKEEELCDWADESVPLDEVLRTLSFLYGRLAVLEKKQSV